MGPGKPGKTWNFIISFARHRMSWNLGLAPGKLWKDIENQQAIYKCKVMKFQKID